MDDKKDEGNMHGEEEEKAETRVKSEAEEGMGADDLLRVQAHEPRAVCVMMEPYDERSELGSLAVVRGEREERKDSLRAARADQARSSSMVARLQPSWESCSRRSITGSGTLDPKMLIAFISSIVTECEGMITFA